MTVFLISGCKFSKKFKPFILTFKSLSLWATSMPCKESTPDLNAFRDSNASGENVESNAASPCCLPLPAPTSPNPKNLPAPPKLASPRLLPSAAPISPAIFLPKSRAPPPIVDAALSGEILPDEFNCSSICLDFALPSANDAWEAQIPEIPEQFHQSLVNKAIAIGYETTPQGIQMAQYFNGKFEDDVKNGRKYAYRARTGTFKTIQGTDF